MYELFLSLVYTCMKVVYKEALNCKGIYTSCISCVYCCYIRSAMTHIFVLILSLHVRLSGVIHFSRIIVIIIFLTGRRSGRNKFGKINDQNDEFFLIKSLHLTSRFLRFVCQEIMKV